MKGLFALIGISSLLSACSMGVDLKHVNLSPLFNDGNSKIWMLDKVLVEDRNFAPKEYKDKDILIFYANGNCSFQPLISLGSSIGKKGEYTIYSDEKTVTMYFEKEKWDFTISNIQNDKIVLKPTKDSELKYSLVLIPLPEIY